MITNWPHLKQWFLLSTICATGRWDNSFAFGHNLNNFSPPTVTLATFTSNLILIFNFIWLPIENAMTCVLHWIKQNTGKNGGTHWLERSRGYYFEDVHEFELNYRIHCTLFRIHIENLSLAWNTPIWQFVEAWNASHDNLNHHHL